MKIACMLLAVALCPIEARAQGAAAGGPHDAEAMRKAMEAAQAAASRPGDDQFDCDQLQQEFAATTTDPALHAQIQAAGAQAQADMAAMGGPANAEVARQTATTAAGSLVPGARMPALAATAANAEAAKARGAERIESRMAQAGQMSAMLPNMMRGQRLVELATARQCAWAAGAIPQE
jgi:hypothetical protein